jgi:hypothetical protein
MIIAATMTLHNYIRAHDRDDIHFEWFDRNPDMCQQFRKYAVPAGASDSSTTETSGRDKDEITDRLATAIALGR